MNLEKLYWLTLKTNEEKAKFVNNRYSYLIGLSYLSLPPSKSGNLTIEDVIDLYDGFYGHSSIEYKK